MEGAAQAAECRVWGAHGGMEGACRQDGGGFEWEGRKEGGKEYWTLSHTYVSPARPVDDYQYLD